MYNYTVEVSGKTYTLKPRTIRVVTMIEETDKEVAKKAASIIDKIGFIIGFINNVIDYPDGVEKLFYKDDKPDPDVDITDIFITYELIKDAYAKPMQDFMQAKLEKSLEDSGLNKIKDALAPLNNLNPDKLNNIKRAK